MKQSEVKEMSVEELKEKIADFKKQVADLKMAHSVTPLENPLLIRNTKRKVARLATELTKRENQYWVLLYGKKKFKKGKSRGCYQ